jgi:hypothetical protein
MKTPSLRSLRLLAWGIFLGGAVGCQQAQPQSTAAPPAESAAAKEIAALKADVQALKDKATSASVAMADVSFHWSNLIFVSYQFSAARYREAHFLRGTRIPTSRHLVCACGRHASSRDA